MYKRQEQIRRFWDASSIERLTPHTITEYSRFQEKIEEVRKKGYALDDEENELGVRCIAVSLPDYKGHARYAFSISAPAARMSDERIAQLAEIILKEKQEIQQNM